MKTVTENLGEMADEIRELLKELLVIHSRSKRWNYPGRNSGMVFIGLGDYSWLPLSDEGRQIQSKTLEDFRHFASIIRSLLKQQPQAA